MPRTILYDGLNLSLKAGTGVATYTRGLLETARALGYRTKVVHATEGAVPKNPVLREIKLFDDENPKTLGPTRRVRRWLRRQVGAPFGLTPALVPLSGTVVLKSFKHRVSSTDDIYAADDLFNLARHHFRRYGNFMRLDLGTGPDLLHCTYPLPIRVKQAPTIYTIHDLVPLRLPYLTEDNKRYFYKLLSRVARRGDHIATVSETSRRDIIEILGADESRVTNTYQAVDVPADLRDKPIRTAAAEIGGVFSLDWKKYLLFFGALEPKKNIMRMVEAYLASGTGLPLVIVGAPGWKSQDEQLLLRDERFGFYQREQDRLHYRRQIRRFEYVPYALLVSLIRGARGVLFPSLYEGFGLPVLEAMQLGTPVIGSKEGSVPEVASSAALLVDPYDTDVMRRAVRMVAFDDDLCGHLAKAGPIQAAKFSPQRYRKAVQSLYDRVLGASC